MREGLDVPGVDLDLEQRKRLLVLLAAAGVIEVELVAPGHFERDIEIAAQVNCASLGIKRTGLIYASGSECEFQLKQAAKILDRVDLLIPLAEVRRPAGKTEKAQAMTQALRMATGLKHVGVGFPHATQVDAEFVLEMCEQADKAGADRITIYDTNGSAMPWQIEKLIATIRGVVSLDICFHGHNDLGLDTANSLAAVRAGASCLDVTVNGLGDRAGNTSLEQVALALQTQGIEHGLRPEYFCELSFAVERMTRVPLSRLAPIVGEFAFCHKSPAHLQHPDLFEAFDPSLVGVVRRLYKGN